MLKYIIISAVLGLSFAAYSIASAGNKTPLTSQATIDLPKYMGRWWVIANIPYFAENGKVATADVYQLKADGKIDNVFAYRKAFGQAEQQMSAEARVYPNTRNTHWQVRFWGGLVRAQLVILEVSPDYQWAILGNPDRSLAWIFSRNPIMDDAQLAVLSEKLRAYGYEPSKLKRVPQTPEQLPAMK